MACPVCSKTDSVPIIKKEDLVLIKCSLCGLVQADNIYSVFDVKNYDYYRNKLSLNEEGLYDFVTTCRYFNLLKKLDWYRKNNTLFDVGCGIGHFLYVAKKMNWEAEGIEIAPFAVEICKKFNLNAKCIDFLESNVRDDYYDIVMMSEVLEHFTQPREYLIKANRVLRKGRVIIITTPNFNCITRLLLKGKWRLIHKEHLLFHANYD